MKKIFESPVVEVKAFAQNNEVMAGVFTLAKSATATSTKTTFVNDSKAADETLDGFDYWTTK